MKKQHYSVEEHGFYGVYDPHPAGSRAAIIALMCLEVDNALMRGFVRFLQSQGLNVLAMVPSPTNDGLCLFPLERFSAAIHMLKALGNERLAITGASATGMVALSAAARHPEFTLTLAMTPCDFVMEGYLRGKKDGTMERPGNDDSALTWRGKPLPFVPYAYRHPQYWQKIQEEGRTTGNKMASRNLFDTSEKMHPVREEEFIPVENIAGKLLLVGAEDDCLWDTCRYIRRMEKRLQARAHSCTLEAHTYIHGTHFIFPQAMVTNILPFGYNKAVGFFFKAARENPQACMKTRQDVEEKFARAIASWKEAPCAF